MRQFVALVAIAGAVACHHAPVQVSATSAPCFSPYQPPVAGTIRIDGPGAFGPQVDDSLIVRVDSSERWRGALHACVRETPGLSIDFKPWQAAGDTLEAIAFDRTELRRHPSVWRLDLVTRRKKQG